MALFKVLKGPSSRIDTTSTPFREGNAYFTNDTGDFYIDAITPDDVEKRFHVNEIKDVSWAVNATLAANQWTHTAGQDYAYQDITVSGLLADSDGMISLSGSATDAQRDAAFQAQLFVFSQSNGVMSIGCDAAEQPTIDIPISLIIFK